MSTHGHVVAGFVRVGRTSVLVAFTLSRMLFVGVAVDVLRELCLAIGLARDTVGSMCIQPL